MRVSSERALVVGDFVGWYSNIILPWLQTRCYCVVYRLYAQAPLTSTFMSGKNRRMAHIVVCCINLLIPNGLALFSIKKTTHRVHIHVYRTQRCGQRHRAVSRRRRYSCSTKSAFVLSRFRSSGGKPRQKYQELVEWRLRGAYLLHFYRIV